MSQGLKSQLRILINCNLASWAVSWVWKCGRAFTTGKDPKVPWITHAGPSKLNANCVARNSTSGTILRTTKSFMSDVAEELRNSNYDVAGRATS